MLVCKEIEFDYGHRVPNHKSKCRNLHGHRARVRVSVDGYIITVPGSSDEGMVIDFGDLKLIMMQEIDESFDHSFIMYDKDPFLSILSQILVQDPMHRLRIVDFVPTAENFAKHIYYKMKGKLITKGIKIKSVEFWETPTSSAVYSEDK
jgi:6-pyruvoyltetrahydropterin/6-carboxytetrahydropterin synthase